VSEKIPLLDLQAQFRVVEKDVRSAIDRVLSSQRFILGPEVEGLEQEVSAYVGCRFGIGVSSGSDALLIALMALGVGPGDEVVTSPYTFFATGGAIARVGAKPVYVDIEPRSFNVDPKKAESALTKKTKAVIPVHLFGQGSDMAPILEMAKSRGLAVIEDAAQAIGAEYQGKRLGSMGVVGCLSFFPSKNLGAMGDAGMVTTNDAELAEKLRIFRSHGSKPKYFHKWIGGNFRIDAIQAAILRAKFPHLENWTKARQQNAERYDRIFKEAGLEEFVALPWRRAEDRHIFNQYVIRVKRRDELKKHLAVKGIETEIYYPLPLHLQECFAYLGYKKGSCPESEKAAQETLAIPNYPEITEEQQGRVVAVIREFLKT
jgi:dTDP-4-amino-4,6-dideoxygalactose transaminase